MIEDSLSPNAEVAVEANPNFTCCRSTNRALVKSQVKGQAPVIQLEELACCLVDVSSPKGQTAEMRRSQGSGKPSSAGHQGALLRRDTSLQYDENWPCISGFQALDSMAKRERRRAKSFVFISGLQVLSNRISWVRF